MATVLIVPGLGGSGPDHWQTWWQTQEAAMRVVQDDWHRPDLARWAECIGATLNRVAAPIWLVAHSFGCLAAVRIAVERPDVVTGALLVAPASPARFGLGPVIPDQPLGVPSQVVASLDDPWMDFAEAEYWARCWGSRLTNLGHAGHINAESGFGPWPLGRSLLAQLQAHAEPADHRRASALPETGRQRNAAARVPRTQPTGAPHAFI